MKLKFYKDTNGVAKVDFRNLDEVRAAGVLWHINRSTFHPQGLAISMGANPSPPPGNFSSSPGISIGMWGNMDEPWSFGKEDDDEGFANYTNFLAKFTAFIEGDATAEEVEL